MLTRISFFASTACVLIAFAAPAIADPSCVPVYDAGVKQMQTPHHVFTTRSHNGKASSTSETIFIDGIVYSQLNGQWQRSRMSGADMLQMAKEKRKEEDPDEKCRIVGDDTIAGDAAQVYTLGNEKGAGSKLWISKATGALLRQAIALPDGSISDSRYEYKNVQAPAAVH